MKKEPDLTGFHGVNVVNEFPVGGAPKPIQKEKEMTTEITDYLDEIQAAHDRVDSIVGSANGALASEHAAIPGLLAIARALERAVYVADHLHAMIDRETWRASGGDDGQGHYEGDYYAEKTADEIQGWRNLLAEFKAGRDG